MVYWVGKEVSQGDRTWLAEKLDVDLIVLEGVIGNGERENQVRSHTILAQIHDDQSELSFRLNAKLNLGEQRGGAPL